MRTTCTDGVGWAVHTVELVRIKRAYPVLGRIPTLTLFEDFRTTSRLPYAIPTYVWTTSSTVSSGLTVLGSCVSNRFGDLISFVPRY